MLTINLIQAENKSRMNLRSLGILSALALVVPASGNIRTGGNDVEFQSSRSFAFQSQSAPSAHRSGTTESKTTPKRSLRGASPSSRADEKNSFRDEAIPLVRYEDLLRIVWCIFGTHCSSCVLLTVRCFWLFLLFIVGATAIGRR